MIGDISFDFIDVDGLSLNTEFTVDGKDGVIILDVVMESIVIFYEIEIGVFHMNLPTTVVEKLVNEHSNFSQNDEFSDPVAQDFYESTITKKMIASTTMKPEIFFEGFADALTIGLRYKTSRRDEADKILISLLTFLESQNVEYWKQEYA